MAKTSEKLRYVLGMLSEAIIERQEILGEIRKLHARIHQMSGTQDTVASIINDLKSTMENQTTVIAGFKAFLTAHDAALAQTIKGQQDAGASSDVIAPLQALRDGYKANTDALVASLVVRTAVDPSIPAPVQQAPEADPTPVPTYTPVPKPAAPVTDDAGTALTPSPVLPTADAPVADQTALTDSSKPSVFGQNTTSV